MKNENLYKTLFAKVYPYYIAKAEKKGRTKAEVDEIILWLTSFSQEEFEQHLANETDFATFYGDTERLNPNRKLIKGVVCGIRVEEITEPLMQEIRYLDKLVDELDKGKTLDKILRK